MKKLRKLIVVLLASLIASCSATPAPPPKLELVRAEVQSRDGFFDPVFSWNCSDADSNCIPTSGTVISEGTGFELAQGNKVGYFMVFYCADGKQCSATVDQIGQKAESSIVMRDPHGADTPTSMFYKDDRGQWHYYYIILPQ